MEEVKNVTVETKEVENAQTTPIQIVVQEAPKESFFKKLGNSVAKFASSPLGVMTIAGGTAVVTGGLAGKHEGRKSGTAAGYEAGRQAYIDQQQLEDARKEAGVTITNF